MGGRNGGSGEGFSGITIKDSWMKPRGLESREGGGDGYSGWENGGG